MYDELCSICPRNCRVNRSSGEKGYCGQSNVIRVARVSLHLWEEPCISGKAGSGTVFFSGCSLKCVYCQNRSIALGTTGIEISLEGLSDIFVLLQEKGANNINLVTPTHYVPQIVKALEKARNKGVKLPVVYNTSGYESVGTLKLLDGLVDIYLTDFKYKNSEIATRYSNAPDYFETADKAVEEMYRQVGRNVFDEDMMKRGMIVRHLVLPGNTKDSKEIIAHLYHKYGKEIYISIMNQYTPVCDVERYSEINRKVTKREYEKVIDYAIELGIENAFIQLGRTANESFIPDFDVPDLLQEIKERK